MTQSRLSDPENLFIASLQQELLELEEKNIPQGMLDNIHQKKSLMIIQFNITLDTLLQQKNNSPEQEKQLNEILQYIHTTLSSIDELNDSTESKFQQHLEVLNQKIHVYNETKKLDEQIATVHYGKNLFSTGDYLDNVLKAGMILFRAWHAGIRVAIHHVSPLFKPIHSLLVSLTILCNFIISIIELVKKSRSNTVLAKENALQEQESKDAESLLKTSIIFKSIVLTLHILSTLAFVGIITTPVGVVFLAAASLVGWIDETFGEYKKNKNAMKKFPALDKDHLLTSEDIKKLELLKKQTAEARRESTWKAVNVIAMILIACGPIPPAGPLVGLIGISMLAIAPARLLYNQAKAEKDKSEAAWKMAAAVSTLGIFSAFIPVVGPALGLAGVLLLGTVGLRYAYVTISPHVKDFFSLKKPSLLPRVSHQDTHASHITMLSAIPPQIQTTEKATNAFIPPAVTIHNSLFKKGNAAPPPKKGPLQAKPFSRKR
ncbi:MAG: hypothetical protein K0S27_308 [Gammaproteobacteria bacterium]|jgi:hypothetical protein|nr:hypothetical protein [Gammaproteobacteria bacterium]